MNSGSGAVIVPKLLTPKQAAEALGMQVFRIRQLIRERRLPAIRVGRTWRISESAIARFIEVEEAKGGAR